MNKNKRPPGLVNEKTVPINSQGTGVEGEDPVVESVHSDNVAKRKHQSQHDKPTPITEQTESIAPELTSTDEKYLEPAKQHHWPGLFLVFIIFIACWLLYATSISLIDVWGTNIWFAIPLTAITGFFIITLVIIVCREWRAFKSVDQIQENQHQLKKYINDNSIIGVHETLKPVLENIKLNYPEEYRQFEEARHDRQTVNEYLSLFENIVLVRLDKDVNDSINRASLSVAGLVAISPHPALDAAMVVYRANLLLRNISNIYGLKLTGFSSLYLFKHTIISAITSAGIEELGSIVLDRIGAGLTGNAAKVVSEGIVSASRMYRLGTLTKKITRPIPK